MVRSALLSVAAVTLVLASQAAFAEDVEKGRGFAKNLCSNCHDIGDGVARTLPAGVPSFHWVSQNRSASEIEARMIRPSHPDMPEAPLTAADRQHLLAYIGSLAKGN
ncbi:MAG: hypothetical protein R3C97_17845 [Geminicoccaceae bacterium]